MFDREGLRRQGVAQVVPEPAERGPAERRLAAGQGGDHRRVEQGLQRRAVGLEPQTQGGMSPHGRPKGEYRSAQHEGSPVRRWR